MDDNTRVALANLTLAVETLVSAVAVLAEPNPAQPDAVSVTPLIATAVAALDAARAAQT